MARRFRILVVSALVAVTGLADRTVAEEPAAVEVSSALSYAKRSVACGSERRKVTAHLAFFSSQAFRLEVLDLGSNLGPGDSGWAGTFRERGLVAGVNGGFFHPDGRPAGLVIADGERINRFETAKLLSGVLYGDDRGIHLVRRAAFRDHPGIAALLQTGPYLVDGGRPPRGLSGASPDRRSFVATDWRGRWVLGASSTPLTLAELGACLAEPGVLTDWPVERAINLDGGSSTGFFFDRDDGKPPVVIQPWKPVRNLVGIAPR